MSGDIGADAGIPLRSNPVLRRELIERVRGVKVVVFVSVWLLLLTGILLLAYEGTTAINDAGGLDIASLGRGGRELFEWVLFGMLILVLFLVPGLTAGAITGERERQTLVPLQMTLMRPTDIVIGKLAAALAFLVLLVVASLPLLATSLLVGGISLLDMARGLGMVIFTGLVLGAVSVFLSSRLKRTTASTVVAYGVALAFAVGAFIGLAAFAVVDAARGNDSVDPPAQILALNPFAAVADSLPRTSGGAFGDDTLTPFGGLRTAIDELGNDGFDGGDERGPRVWIWYSVGGLALLVLSVRSAGAAVRTPADAER